MSEYTMLPPDKGMLHSAIDLPDSIMCLDITILLDCSDFSSSLKLLTDYGSSSRIPSSIPLELSTIPSFSSSKTSSLMSLGTWRETAIYWG